MRSLVAACALLVAFAAAAGAEEARPQRIVSINMCTDELLLRLADKARIASVTWLSQDARNANMAEAAKAFPANHGMAEEVLAYRPDLVLAGAFTTRATVDALKRTGVKVVEFGAPETLDGVRKEIRALAAAIGEPARGEALVNDMESELAALAPIAHKPPLKAIVLRPNGFTVAKGSLVDELMTRAGLDNMAARLGFANYRQIPLEAIALQQADVLILNGERDGPPSLATEALNHPIVAALGRRLRVISMPSRLWTCAGPSVVEAIRLLIERTSGQTVAAP